MASIYLPGLSDVDNVDAIWTCLPDIWLHVGLQVLGAEMRLSGQQVFDVLAGGIKRWGEVGGSHGEVWYWRWSRYKGGVEVVVQRSKSSRCSIEFRRYSTARAWLWVG